MEVTLRAHHRRADGASRTGINNQRCLTEIQCCIRVANSLTIRGDPSSHALSWAYPKSKERVNLSLLTYSQTEIVCI